MDPPRRAGLPVSQHVEFRSGLAGETVLMEELRDDIVTDAAAMPVNEWHKESVVERS